MFSVKLFQGSHEESKTWLAKTVFKTSVEVSALQALEFLGPP